MRRPASPKKSSIRCRANARAPACTICRAITSCATTSSISWSRAPGRIEPATHPPRHSTPPHHPFKHRSQPMNRNDITEKIITAKVSKGLTWESVAKKVGLSKEWTTAGCLGQMTFDAKQAKIVGKIFGLTAEEQKWLQAVPYKDSLPTPVPTDPQIYRWYEIVNVYGTT